MITQDELDYFVREFEDEDPALVGQALEECVKIFRRSQWNTMYSGSQVNAVWCWIAGWKARDEQKFVVKESGFGKGMSFAHGGLVEGFSVSTDCDMSVLLESGEVRVSKEVVAKYGTELLCRLNTGKLPVDCKIKGETVVLVDGEST